MSEPMELRINGKFATETEVNAVLDLFHEHKIELRPKMNHWTWSFLKHREEEADHARH